MYEKSEKMDQFRTETLNQMERTERNYKLAFVGAALAEALFLAVFVLLADFSNRTHLLMLVAAVAIYGILAFGLIALGVHVNRNTLRIIRAIETIERS